MPKNIFIKPPDNFRFVPTVYSHGWSELLPFQLDSEKWKLTYIFDNEHLENPVSAVISENEKGLKIEFSNGKIGKKAEAKILQDVKHILRIDEDLSEFYKLSDA